MLIVDAHLDLSMNAMEWNRDLRLSVTDLRARETGMNDKPDRSRGTVSLPELRRGGIGLVVATQIARYAAPGNPLPGWHSPSQAWAQTQGQLAWYRAMEEAGEMVMIKDLAGLEAHLGLWMKGQGGPRDRGGNGASPETGRNGESLEAGGKGASPETGRNGESLEAGGKGASPETGRNGESLEAGGKGASPEAGKKEASADADPDKRPVGYILSLEGADSLINPADVGRAYAYGLRAVGPAHYGPGRYANGTDSRGGLTREGKALLKEMQKLGMILDATHLCDDAFRDAMELYQGPVWASHNNCRALVDHNRQFSDEMIRALIDKDAVIGGALDAWMMVPGWVRGQSDPRGMQCKLEVVIDHLDHICQIAGNALHVGMGTDLDGGFGREQCPYDLDTIADLRRMPELLAKRGYPARDIDNIMHGNWLRFLRKAWS